MNAIFKVYDALKRNGMNDDDARTLSEAIGERGPGGEAGKVDDRLKGVENRLGKVEERLKGVENGIDKADERLTGVENRLEKVEERLTGVEGRLDKVEDSLGKAKQTLGNVNTKVETGFTFLRWMLAFQGAAIIAILVKVYL